MTNFPYLELFTSFLGPRKAFPLWKSPKSSCDSFCLQIWPLPPSLQPLVLLLSSSIIFENQSIIQKHYLSPAAPLTCFFSRAWVKMPAVSITVQFLVV